MGFMNLNLNTTLKPTFRLVKVQFKYQLFAIKVVAHISQLTSQMDYPHEMRNRPGIYQ